MVNPIAVPSFYKKPSPHGDSVAHGIELWMIVWPVRRNKGDFFEEQAMVTEVTEVAAIVWIIVK